MTTSAQWQRTLDAVVVLAEDIARLSPDCADRAMQIVRLIRAVDSPPRGAGGCLDAAEDLDTADLDLADVDLADPDVGPLRRTRTSDVI